MDAIDIPWSIPFEFYPGIVDRAVK